MVFCGVAESFLGFVLCGLVDPGTVEVHKGLQRLLTEFRSLFRIFLSLPHHALQHLNLPCMNHEQTRATRKVLTGQLSMQFHVPPQFQLLNGNCRAQALM